MSALPFFQHKIIDKFRQNYSMQMGSSILRSVFWNDRCSKAYYTIKGRTAAPAVRPLIAHKKTIFISEISVF